MRCLSNRCRVFCWLPAFLSFICFSSNSYASTAPSNVWIGGGSYDGTSGSQLCTSKGYSSFTGGFFQTVNPSPGFIAGVGYFHTYLGSEYGWCASYEGATNGPQVFQSDFCSEAGYIMQDGRMYCGTGPYVPPEPCPTAGTVSSGTNYLLDNQLISTGSTICTDEGGSECAATCTDAVSVNNPVTGIIASMCFSYTSTGSSCDPETPIGVVATDLPPTMTATPTTSPPASKNDCPGGSGFAEVNGVGKCMPAGTTYSGPASTSSSGSGSVTNITSTTINNNGSTTTTTISTYKDAAGNITYEGASTSGGGAIAIGGTGSGTGSGTGDGQKLDFGPAPVNDETLPSEATFTVKAQGNPVFSTEIFTTTASCPAPITYTAMGQELSIDFSPICAFSDVIRGIILMLAAIVSLRSIVTS